MKGLERTGMIACNMHEHECQTRKEMQLLQSYWFDEFIEMHPASKPKIDYLSLGIRR